MSPFIINPRYVYPLRTGLFFSATVYLQVVNSPFLHIDTAPVQKPYWEYSTTEEIWSKNSILPWMLKITLPLFLAF